MTTRFEALKLILSPCRS